MNNHLQHFCKATQIPATIFGTAPLNVSIAAPPKSKVYIHYQSLRLKLGNTLSLNIMLTISNFAPTCQQTLIRLLVVCLINILIVMVSQQTIN